MKYISRLIFLTISYFLLGKLSLLLAIPPGYSAPIWPSAGIASAAIVLWGYNYLPAVFFGSLITNLFASGNEPHWEAASLIAMGATLQALTCTWLLSRVVTLSTSLEKENDIFSILILGGPIPCLVNGLLGPLSLVYVGIIPQDSLFQTAFTWWAGDSIGSMLILPLSIILSNSFISQQRKASITFPFILLSSAVLLLFVNTRQSEELHLRHLFENIVSTKFEKIEQHFQTTQNILKSIKSFYDASNFIDRQEFQLFTQHTLKNHKGVLALEWIPRVPFSEKTKFESLAHKDGFTTFQINEKIDNKRVPVEKRNEYFPIFYVEPYSRNSQALGFDLASNPIRLKALNQAKEKQTQVATAPIRLIQEKQSQPGFLIFEPIYSTTKKLKGFALGAFRIKELIDTVLGENSKQNHMFFLTLTDLKAPEEDKIIYVKGAIEPSFFHWKKNIWVGGREWSLHFSPTQEFFLHHNQWQSWYVLIGGLLFTSLLTGFILSTTGRTEIIKEKVNEKTSKLRKSENFIRSILHFAADSIISIDENGFIKSFNPASITLFSYTEKEVLNKHIKLLIPNLHFPNALYKQEELEGRQKDGHTFPIELSHSSVTDEKSILSIFIIRDITERKRMENMKNEFISTVNHELRTPLTSIQGSLFLLKHSINEELNEENRSILNLACRNCESLIYLVNDILDMEKIVSGEMSLNLEHIKVASLIEETLEQNKQYALKHKVNFSFQNLSKHDVYSNLDKQRFIQALSNLLSNAAKFSPENETVTVSLQMNGQNNIKITVADKGPGIPEAFKKKIFQKFSQADSSSTRKKGGSGLGLFITKSLINKFKGTVSFNSEEGKGSEFYFILPTCEKP